MGIHLYVPAGREDQCSEDHMKQAKHSRSFRSGTIVLLLLVILAVPPGPAKAALQLPVNGDFEQGPGVGWQVWPPDAASPIWNTAAHNGQPALAQGSVWLRALFNTHVLRSLDQFFYPPRTIYQTGTGAEFCRRTIGINAE